jgi:hypothetical protein
MFGVGGKTEYSVYVSAMTSATLTEAPAAREGGRRNAAAAIGIVACRRMMQPLTTAIAAYLLPA